MARVYEYDVFISYQRAGNSVPAWVRNHLFPVLSDILDNNLDREVRIFFDDQIPNGSSWPMELQAALRRTRILLAVCSPKYFFNEWCLAEWQSMEQREELLGMASQANPKGLIYPVIFCDSQNFPEFATTRRMRDLKQWNLHYPQFQATAQYLDFHREVDQISQELVELIDEAPDWQPDWPVATPGPDRAPTARLPRF